MPTPAAIPWVQFDERVVGEAHPTFEDVDNRPLKFIITQSGLAETDDFPGFAVRYSGSGSPEGSVEAAPPAIYIDEDDGTVYVKVTGTGDTGWVEVGGGNAFGTGTPEAVVAGDIGNLYEQRDAAADEHPVWFKATGATPTDTLWRKFAGFIDNDSIVVGDGNTWGSFSVVIGQENEADDEATAIGVGAFANASQAVAIGKGVNTFTGGGAQSIAIGAFPAVDAAATDGIAIGTSSAIGAAALKGVAIGRLATVNSVDAIAIGTSATVNTSSDNGIAIGEGAVARGVGAIIIGLSAAHANGQASDVVIGNAATSVGGSGVCIGGGASNAAGGSTTSVSIMGTIHSSSGGGNVVLGGVTTAGGSGTAGAVVIGYSASSTDRGTAVGFNADATGAVAIAIGYGAQATTSTSLAIGWQANSGTNTKGIAIGNTATVTGDEAIAIGNQPSVASTKGIVIGNGTMVSASTTAIAIGTGHTLTTMGTSCVAIGTACVTSTTAGSVTIGSACSVAGASGTAIGSGASITVGGSSRSVAIEGTVSGGSLGKNIVIGAASTAGGSCCLVGFDTTAAASGPIFFGTATIGSSATFCYGLGSVSVNFASCINIGQCTAFAAQTFQVGMNHSLNPITTVCIGNGLDTSSAAASILYRQTNKSGSDAAGTNYTIQPGLATGNAAEGAFKVQIGSAIASGSTLQTATVRFVVGRTVAVGTTVATNHAFQVTTSVTASSALATTINSQGTLVAAANADVLAAFRAAPTFTVGAFTGTIGVGLEIATLTGPASIYAIRSVPSRANFGQTADNTGNTLGVTINQGAGTDEILSFKSSDVAHGMTTATETDTYGMMRKFSSSDGGLRISGYSDVTTGLQLAGNSVTEDTTKSTSSSGAVEIRGLTKTGTTVTTPGANANVLTVKSGGTNVMIVDADGDAHISNRAWVGALGITNANQTIGITINQGAADDEILAFKSSDVAHGITTPTETDTFALFMKRSATQGGLFIRAFTEGTIGFTMESSVTTGVTTKSSAADAAIMLDGRLKSGTTTTSLGANSNILSVQDTGTTRFILDADGDSHQDVGTSWTNFDDHDDIKLLNGLAAHVSKESDPLRGGLAEWMETSRGHLEKLKLAQFNDDGHHFVNMSRLTMLHTGALRQLGARFERIERALVAANLLPAEV